MNKLMAMAAVALLAGGAMAGETATFIGFNIWGDYFNNPVEERADGILSVVNRYHPDLFAMQEVTRGWWQSKLFTELERAGYVVVKGNVEKSFKRARGGSLPNDRKFNHVPLAFRADRYELLDSGFDVFHVRLDYNKGVTWAVLKDRKTGKGLIAFSTHFWYQENGKESDAIREMDAEMVMWRLKVLKLKYPYPVIGGGDLNSLPNCWAYQALTAGGYRSAVEVADVPSPISSWHGDPKRDATGKYRGKLREKNNTPATSIDHVFVEAKRLHVLKHTIVTDQEVLDASDHSPVMVEFDEK